MMGKTCVQGSHPDAWETSQSKIPTCKALDRLARTPSRPSPKLRRAELTPAEQKLLEDRQILPLNAPFVRQVGGHPMQTTH